jgi:hypothetical protein
MIEEFCRGYCNIYFDALIDLDTSVNRTNEC